MSFLIQQLHECDAIKFNHVEQFILKSGQKSSIYVDIREAMGYPKILDSIAEHLVEGIKDKVDLSKDVAICGVPYGAIPLATLVASKLGLPLMVLRKQAKEHGTKKLIEGGCDTTKCILIEDVITTGGSVMEAIQQLESSGITIVSVITVVDRQGGGIQTLRAAEFKVSSLISIDEIKTYLDIFNSNASELVKRFRMTMERKKTNLILSADVKFKYELFNLLDKVGKYICAVKIHSDIIKSDKYDEDDLYESISERYDVLVIEDRKFADIGSIAKRQLEKIFPYADMVTVHAIAGEGIIESLTPGNYNRPGLLLISDMSTEGNLCDKNYREAVCKMADRYPGKVSGLITQHRGINENDNILYITPGVHLERSKDYENQQYRTPHEAIARDGCDAIIVGRGIYHDTDPVDAAKKYRDAAWKARLEVNPDSL